jgi:hypothetical protein
MLPTDQVGITIHHPQGYNKKVSVQNDALNSGCDENNGIKPFLSYDEGNTGFQKDKILDNNGDRFAVTFDRGIIMGGSSGSPFFNSQGKV